MFRTASRFAMGDRRPNPTASLPRRSARERRVLAWPPRVDRRGKGRAQAEVPTMKWFFEPGHSAAEFRARHMMVTWVRGSFKNVHGTLDFDPNNPPALSVEATIDAQACWTGEAA